MSSKIDQIANAGLTPRPNQGSGAQAAGAGNRAQAASDSVRLTGDSERVAAAERSLTAQTDIDVEKVQTIRDALAAGEYRVDAGRVADAMSALEQLLVAGK